jgi:hypothetical protein
MFIMSKETNKLFEVEVEKEEKNETKRQPNAGKGLLILAGVGAGMAFCGYLYGSLEGYRHGVKGGYNQGVKDGIIYMNNRLLETAKAMAEAGKESKGES